jgi:hypothetical protein
VYGVGGQDVRVGQFLRASGTTVQQGAIHLRGLIVQPEQVQMTRKIICAHSHHPNTDPEQVHLSLRIAGLSPSGSRLDRMLPNVPLASWCRDVIGAPADFIG